MFNTILVVDDDPLVLGVISRTLAMHGFHVLTAEHGVKAETVLENNTVDVVVTDMNMPVMDGPTLIKNIKGRTPTLPVIAMTGNISAYESFTPEGVGCDATMMKPFSGRDLVKMLQDAFTTSQSNLQCSSA